MNTLKEAKIGQTVTVVKLHGRRGKAQNYGYGYNKRCIRVHKKSCPSRRPD